MKTQKISFLLAIFVGAGILLAGIASAASDPVPGPASESIFIEIQASGKGYDVESDDPLAPAPGIIYTEDKHASTIKCYAMCDLSNGLFRLAYQASNGAWLQQAISSAVETEESVLVRINGTIPIYYDSAAFSAIGATGTLRVQFKKQDGVFTNAKLKSLAMAYFQSKDKDPDGNEQLTGALKMKGAMIDPYDMPTDVQVLFGIPL